MSQILKAGMTLLRRLVFFINLPVIIALGYHAGEIPRVIFGSDLWLYAGQLISIRNFDDRKLRDSSLKVH